MCGSCCRNDWLVTVDEAGYHRNARLFAQAGREGEFQQVFAVIDPTEAAPGEYARIAKQPGGGCWFLLPDQCCALHRTAGHEHLDAVCQTFPRYPMDTSRGNEVTLSFSCPAVLRLAMRLDPLVVVRSEEAPCVVPEGEAVLSVYPRQQPVEGLLRYYYELEHHVIDLLQCRSLTIPARIELVRQTVEELLASEDEAPMGERLAKRIRGNYIFIDDLPLRPAPETLTPAVLTEHFLVNFIFKKALYVHHPRRAVALMLAFVERIGRGCDQDWDGAGPLPQVVEIIQHLEFDYGHNRRTMQE